jgi:Ca2+-binding RTX toxin-like protein
MAHQSPVRRRLLALLAMSMTTAGMLLVTAGPALAVDACTGASEIIDAGTYYIVKGTKGDDWIDCTNADKRVEIRGGAGNDYLFGSLYEDILKGDHGNDWLYGNSGDDWLLGGQGNDYMSGDLDYDTCLGGRGLDSFGSVGGACEIQDFGREP